MTPLVNLYQFCLSKATEKGLSECGLSCGFSGRESDSNTSENPIQQTILFFAKGNSLQRFAAG